MKRITLFALLLTIPAIAFAAISDANSFLDYVLIILKDISGILGSLALVFFFWNLIIFIKKSNEGATDLKKSQGMMIWSIVTLFMMIGIWSVVFYVQSSVGADISNSDITDLPVLPDESNL